MPLVTFALNTPQVAQPLIEALFRSTLECFEWPEMMKYVRIIITLKKDYSDILTRIFWSERMIRETVKSFQESPECFPSLCKFTALFIKDIPVDYKDYLLTYILSSYNCYTYLVSEKPDNPPRPEDLKSMEEEMEAILQVFCETWQHGARRLFDALVNDPVCSEEGAIEMVVNSVTVHKAITRVFEEGMADLPSHPAEYASNARRFLLGMAIAYVAMCSPGMKSLPKFIEDLRSHIAIGADDPLIAFEAAKVARAIMYLTVQPSSYSSETESLLAACFAKSAPFEVDEKFVSFVDKALEFVSGPACLQKLFILCNSPFFVRAMGSLLKPFIDDVIDTDDISMHYVAAIRKLLTQPAPAPAPAPEQQQQQQQVPVQSESMSAETAPQQVQQPPPSVASEEPKDKKDVVEQKGEQEDDDDEEEQQQPMGLPPSDSDMA